jgi:hypothetical protein
MKFTKNEFAHHSRQIFFTVLYLATSLSLIATFRSLVLIQQGINDFAHSYAVALIMAVFLGKIVVFAQKLPFIHALNHKQLIQSVFYKATVMTVIADLALMIEHKLFGHHQDQNVASVNHALAMTVAHQLSLFLIFSVLFTFRDLDRVLGEGTLFKLFFLSREEQLPVASETPQE